MQVPSFGSRFKWVPWRERLVLTESIKAWKCRAQRGVQSTCNWKTNISPLTSQTPLSLSQLQSCIYLWSASVEPTPSRFCFTSKLIGLQMWYKKQDAFFHCIKLSPIEDRTCVLGLMLYMYDPGNLAGPLDNFFCRTFLWSVIGTFWMTGNFLTILFYLVAMFYVIFTTSVKIESSAVLLWVTVWVRGQKYCP